MPTFAHIVRDFLAAGKDKIALTPIHSGVGIFNPNNFLTSLIVLSNNPGADPVNRMQTPLGSRMECPIIKDGLEQCRIRLQPERHLFVSPVCIGSKLLPDYRKKLAVFHMIIKPRGNSYRRPRRGSSHSEYLDTDCRDESASD